MIKLASSVTSRPANKPQKIYDNSKHVTLYKGSLQGASSEDLGCAQCNHTIFSPKLAVRESITKSAARAASLDYVKFQAVIKLASSAASLRGGHASGRLDHVYFLHFLAALTATK